MKPDGQDVKRLTDNAATDQKPVWSRDHSKIAWVSDRDGNFEIYSQNVVNGEAHGLPVRLTDNAARDDEPSWSPDGKQLVFTSNRDGQRELYVLDVAGNSTRRLTQRPGNEDYSPAWSPQGDKIAFQSRTVDTGQARSGIPSFIYTIKTNGEDIQKVTNGFFDADPVWHPDGSKITFWRSSPLILSVDLKTRIETAVSAEGYSHPSYNPDGTQIACVRGFSVGEFEKESTNTEIFVLDVNEATNEPKRITNNPAQDETPAW